jgi:hypothetical protein
VRGDREDLMGGARSRRRFIGWTTFFRFLGFEGDVPPNKRIVAKLSPLLFDVLQPAEPAADRARCHRQFRVTDFPIVARFAGQR